MQGQNKAAARTKWYRLDRNCASFSATTAAPQGPPMAAPSPAFIAAAFPTSFLVLQCTFTAVLYSLVSIASSHCLSSSSWTVPATSGCFSACTPPATLCQGFSGGLQWTNGAHCVVRYAHSLERSTICEAHMLQVFPCALALSLLSCS